jgi:hypothetical protein
MPSVNLNLVYRDQMVRAVMGDRPAVLAKEVDTVALARFAQRLADAEEAIQLLCANGYGIPAQPLPELVRAALNLKAA